MRTADEIKASRKKPTTPGGKVRAAPRPEQELGKALQAARLAVGLTAKEVATEIGVSGSSTVLNWEGGYGAPTPRSLARLAHLYGLSLDALCAHYISEARQ